MIEGMIDGVTEPALVIAPLVCSAVLLLSGLAKLGDVDGTQASFAAMRVPQPLTATPVVRAVPAAEIALGALLLVCWGWALAVVGAAVTALFAVYWVLVLRVVRSGEDVDCGCFGSVGDAKVTGSTLARNSLLVLLAGAATAYGAAGSGVVPMLRDLGPGEAWWLLMSAAAAATAVLVVGLRRQDVGPESLADTELLDYERTPIPFAVLQDADGNTKSLSQVARARPQLLVLLSGSCGSCHEIAAQMSEWVPRLGQVAVQAVYSERLDKLPEKALPEAGVRTWYDVERGATQAFASGGRPAAVLLGADGQLAGGPVYGKPAVLQFVEDIVAELEGREPETLDADEQPTNGHDHGHSHGHPDGHPDGHSHGPDNGHAHAHDQAPASQDA